MKIKYLVLLAVSGTVIALDQMTKLMIAHKFVLHESYTVVSRFFNLVYVQNPGAAFGLLAKLDPSIRVPFFIIVPLFALGMIGVVFKKVEDRDVFLAVGLSLIIGGAVGNLVDRAAYNYVIDFLQFHWNESFYYPAFNVADAAISTGVGMLVFDLIKKERPKKNASSSV